MVKTSILVDVEENVNELVVKPHKRAKTFSKLIATLLQGYIEDDYIRSYAEGTLNGMHKASVDVLDDALFTMQESLFSMGVYTSELKSSNQEGYSQFQKRAKQAEEDLSRDSEYFSEMKTEIDDLKAQNGQIMDMLKALMSLKELPLVESSGDKATFNPFNESKDTVHSDVKVDVLPEQEITITSESKLEDEEEEIITHIPLKVIEDDEEEAEESDIDAARLLSGLLIGNEFSF